MGGKIRAATFAALGGKFKAVGGKRRRPAQKRVFRPGAAFYHGPVSSPLPPDYHERVYAGVLGKIIGVYTGSTCPQRTVTAA